jgi:flagellar basal body rod protein FlgG
MSGGIYVALSGAVAQSASLDATATNLANASTDGYQRIRPLFREALASAGANATPLHSVSGGATSLDTSKGALRTTGNALDVALPDRTYLSVSTARGERYTRAGALAIGRDETLQTSRGEPLVDENGKAIRAPADQGPVRLSPSGEVWQGDTRVGRIRLVSFQTPEQLAPEGGTLLNATAGSGVATTAKGELSIGSLEESNTSIVGAMTDLVTASRNFDAFQRAIDAFQQADQRIMTTVPGDS